MGWQVPLNPDLPTVQQWCQPTRHRTGQVAGRLESSVIDPDRVLVVEIFRLAFQIEMLIRLDYGLVVLASHDFGLDFPEELSSQGAPALVVAHDCTPGIRRPPLPRHQVSARDSLDCT